MNYLFLVNKKNKIPKNWANNVNLIEVKNRKDELIQIEKEAYKKFKELKKALEKEEIIIALNDAYRSVEEQQKIWDTWLENEGLEYVEQYVATPGYSEHHTGLALDIYIGTKEENKELEEEESEEVKEEKRNKIFATVDKYLANYGFILRYPKNKEHITGYSYEPWHIRYIKDSKIAKYLYKNNLTLEEFLNKERK